MLVYSILVPLTVSDLVSDMCEKKVPFSEWEHYTVRAWLEVPSTCASLGV